jgi:hypothetical protein
MNIVNIKRKINELLKENNSTDQNIQKINDLKKLINSLINPVIYTTPYSKHTMPWDTGSNLLYVALVIDPASYIGLVITKRAQAIKRPHWKTKVLTSINPFESYKDPTKNLYTPHISLIKIYIRDESELNTKLTTKLDQLYSIIATCFDLTLKDKQLHSEYGKYDLYGNFISRIYDDPVYLEEIQNQQYLFLEAIIRNLTITIMGEKKENLIIEKYKQFKTSPAPTSTTITYYSNKEKKLDMAIESFYTDHNFIPHISLFGKDPQKADKADINAEIETFQNASDRRPMGWINLWNSSKQNLVTDIHTKKSMNLNGSLSYIFVSYNEQIKYIPI